MLGQKIKLARKASGLSLRSFGDAIGVSRATVQNYEKGITSPNDDILRAISEATGFDIKYFTKKDRQIMIEPEFRKRSSMTKKAQNRIEVYTLEWLERYLEVEEYFEDIDFILNENNYKINCEEPEQIEKAAEKLRDEWKIGIRPIESMVQLLEDKNVKVLKLNEVKTFDAMKFIHNKKPVIVFNGNMSPDRQMFTLAHELGHIVLNPDNESAAHRFASAFLFPRKNVYREIGYNRSSLHFVELLNLKKKYRMSMSAIARRAFDLGIITQYYYRTIMINFSKNHFRTNEPGSDELCPEEPKRLELFIFGLLAEEVISKSKAEELLGRPINNNYRDSLDIFKTL